MNTNTAQIIRAILEGFGYRPQTEILSGDQGISVFVEKDGRPVTFASVSLTSMKKSKQAARVLVEYGFTETRTKGVWIPTSPVVGPADKLEEGSPRMLRALIRIARRINEKRTTDKTLEYTTQTWLGSLEEDIWRTIAEILGRCP